MVEPELVMLVAKVPCNSITKRQDQTLNVRVNYTYKGSAIRGRLGAVVTQKTFYSEFDEIGSTRKEVYVDLPASATPKNLYTDIRGMPLSGCVPKTGYGIKVYALDLDGKPEWGCLSMLTVTEVAPLKKYTLTLTVSPSGAGYVTGAGEYEADTWATITAYPYSGYVFDHWGGDYYGTANPASIVMAFNKTVTAYFKPTVPPAEFTLTVRALPLAGGWVTKSPDKPTYSFGEMVRLTASAAPGYRFYYWDCDGEWLRRLDGTVELSTSINFIVMASHTVTAHFVRV